MNSAELSLTPFVQWVRVAFPTSMMPSPTHPVGHFRDAPHHHAGRRTPSGGVSPSTDSTLTINGVRSLLKFIGVKPQFASEAGNLLVNSLALEALGYQRRTTSSLWAGHPASADAADVGNRRVDSWEPPGGGSFTSKQQDAAVSASSSTGTASRGRKHLSDNDDVSSSVHSSVMRSGRLVFVEGVHFEPTELSSCDAFTAWLFGSHVVADADAVVVGVDPTITCGFVIDLSLPAFLSAVRNLLNVQRQMVGSSARQHLLSLRHSVSASTAPSTGVLVSEPAHERTETSAAGGRSVITLDPLGGVDDATKRLRGFSSSSTAASPTGSTPGWGLSVSARRVDDRVVFSLQMQQRQRPLVILVGGTSGCGKSTLAHLLANRLGIATVISTDGVRELLRSKRCPRCYPELFGSTYEAHRSVVVGGVAVSSAQKVAGGTLCMRHRSVHEEDRQEALLDAQMHHDDDDVNHSLVVRSFERQSRMVLQVVDRLIRVHMNRGESVLVEGVHLLPEYCANLTKALAARKASPACATPSGNGPTFHSHLPSPSFSGAPPRTSSEPLTAPILCVPMIVRIVKGEKHFLRFAIRSKSMTLKPQENKYAANFSAIRSIQDTLVEGAQRFGLLLVNNTNVDKSLSTIQSFALRAVDRMAASSILSAQHHPPSLSGAQPSSVASLAGVAAPPHAIGPLPLPTQEEGLEDVKGKVVFSLLRFRRQEKQSRRARSADACCPTPGGSQTPTVLLSPAVPCASPPAALQPRHPSAKDLPELHSGHLCTACVAEEEKVPSIMPICAPLEEAEGFGQHRPVLPRNAVQATSLLVGPPPSTPEASQQRAVHHHARSFSADALNPRHGSLGHADRLSSAREAYASGEDDQKRSSCSSRSGTPPGSDDEEATDGDDDLCHAEPTTIQHSLEEDADGGGGPLRPDSNSSLLKRRHAAGGGGIVLLHPNQSQRQRQHSRGMSIEDDDDAPSLVGS